MPSDDDRILGGEVLGPGHPPPGLKAIEHVAQIEVKSKPKMTNFTPFRRYNSAEELFWKICEYFEWSRENPMTTNKPMTVSVGNNGGSEIMQGISYHERPLTITGLIVYIGVAPSLWAEWQNVDSPKHWPRAMPVIEWAKAVIADQKYRGALIGAYNPMLVARDLGLVDKSEVETKNLNIDIQKKMTINPKDLTYSERKAILDAIDKKRAEQAKLIGSSDDDGDIDDLLG